MNPAVGPWAVLDKGTRKKEKFGQFRPGWAGQLLKCLINSILDRKTVEMLINAHNLRNVFSHVFHHNKVGTVTV